MSVNSLCFWMPEISRRFEDVLRQVDNFIKNIHSDKKSHPIKLMLIGIQQRVSLTQCLVSLSVLCIHVRIWRWNKSYTEYFWHPTAFFLIPDNVFFFFLSKHIRRGADKAAKIKISDKHLKLFLFFNCASNYEEKRDMWYEQLITIIKDKNRKYWIVHYYLRSFNCWLSSNK